MHSGAPRSGAPLNRLERAARGRLRAGAARAFDFAAGRAWRGKIEARRAETACGLGRLRRKPDRRLRRAAKGSLWNWLCQVFPSTRAGWERSPFGSVAAGIRAQRGVCGAASRIYGPGRHTRGRDSGRAGRGLGWVNRLVNPHHAPPAGAEGAGAGAGLSPPP